MHSLISCIQENPRRDDTKTDNASWAIMYLFVYPLFSIQPVTDDIRNESEPLWSSIAELLADACLILSALCYWLPSINHILFGYSEAAYMTGLAILIGQTGRADGWHFRHFADHDHHRATVVLGLHGHRARRLP